jgi:hypothetical protein
VRAHCVCVQLRELLLVAVFSRSCKHSCVSRRCQPRVAGVTAAPPHEQEAEWLRWFLDLARWARGRPVEGGGGVQIANAARAASSTGMQPLLHLHLDVRQR